MEFYDFHVLHDSQIGFLDFHDFCDFHMKL